MARSRKINGRDPIILTSTRARRESIPKETKIAIWQPNNGGKNENNYHYYAPLLFTYIHHFLIPIGKAHIARRSVSAPLTRFFARRVSLHARTSEKRAPVTKRRQANFIIRKKLKATELIARYYSPQHTDGLDRYVCTFESTRPARRAVLGTGARLEIGSSIKNTPARSGPGRRTRRAAGKERELYTIYTKYNYFPIFRPHFLALARGQDAREDLIYL